jgi:hypothetical protein
LTVGSNQELSHPVCGCKESHHQEGTCPFQPSVARCSFVTNGEKIHTDIILAVNQRFWVVYSPNNWIEKPLIDEVKRILYVFSCGELQWISCNKELE